jgi:hypothetical protein
MLGDSFWHQTVGGTDRSPLPRHLLYAASYPQAVDQNTCPNLKTGAFIYAKQ